MSRAQEPSKDHLTRDQRSRLMGRVRQRDTALETTLGKTMWARGLRYRKNRRIHGTRPDFSFVGAKLAIYTDGCFWHGCPTHYTAPVGNSEFWENKLRVNRARDERNNEALREAEWTVLRFWECEISSGLEEAVDAVVEFLDRRGSV